MIFLLLLIFTVVFHHQQYHYIYSFTSIQQRKKETKIRYPVYSLLLMELHNKYNFYYGNDINIVLNETLKCLPWRLLYDINFNWKKTLKLRSLSHQQLIDQGCELYRIQNISWTKIYRFIKKPRLTFIMERKP